MRVLEEMEFDRKMIEKRKVCRYQAALNDVISNAGTAFKCKHDSFWLLQELVDLRLEEELKDFEIIEMEEA